jgi:two-component system, OmpR family, sensor histidine kinase KdpD
MGRNVQFYALALFTIAGTTALLIPVRAHLNVLNVALIYLIVVTLLSLRVDTGPGIVASLAAFLAFNFCFIPPYYTFTVADSSHLLVLVVFLGIAILVTQLVVRVRLRTIDALRRERQTTTLYRLSQSLIGELDLDEMLMAIVVRVREVFALDSAAIMLRESETLVARAVAGDSLDLTNPAMIELGRHVMETRESASREATRRRQPSPEAPGRAGADALALERLPPHVLVLPIETARRGLGALIVARHAGGASFDMEERRLLETFANQAAIAIDRSILSGEQTRAEILARSDALKSVLLSAVSHDLRTPLASIKASATSLLQPDVTWTEEDRRELLRAIDEEADRLDQLVADLLDLSRIDSGALQPAFAWYELSEVVYDALSECESRLKDHRVIVDLSPDLQPLWIDYVEIRRVLVNLLENAGKYSAPETRVTLSARQEGDNVLVAVSDEGVSVPPGEEERIFDKFYRIDARGRPIGSGVGLAICRGFIEAHGGRIWATRNEGRGLTVRFTLPVTEPRGHGSPSRASLDNGGVAGEC